MPKRKKAQTEEQAKKQKIDSSDDPAIITKQPKNPQQENIPWPEQDLLQLLKNIEENIPKDDSVSYICRLEKLNWENVAFKSHSAKECQEIWGQLYKKVRKFRLLGELVTDIKELVHTSGPPPPVKHPDKPKKPCNSYMLFVEDKRHELMSENPNLRSREVSKKLGQMFKVLPTEEKEKYENQAKAARQEYLAKLQSFYEEHPELKPQKTNRRQKSAPAENFPLEKPKTPFELFVQTESENQTDSSRFVIVQKCKERWNQLGDREKYFWINWADELHAKYLTDLKEYMKSHPDYEPEKFKPVLTKKEQNIKDRHSGKPERPPSGPYHLFCKMMLESEEVRKINNRDVMNYVSEKWRACSDEDKNEYKVRVEQMWESYYKKLDEYVMTLPPEERERVLELETRRKKRTEKKVETKEAPVKMAKPESPPPTPHKYFLKTYKGDEDPKTVWKTMTEAERTVFAEELDQERKTYIGLYEKYLKSLSREELEKLGASLGNQHDSSGESESETSDED